MDPSLNKVKEEYIDYISEDELTWPEVVFSKHCLGKAECDYFIDGPAGLDQKLWELTDECKEFAKFMFEHDGRPEFMIVGDCILDDVINPFSGDIMHKETLGVIIVSLDILVVMIVVCFITYLHRRQKDYIDQFKDQTIEMTDFTIRVENLPPDYMFQGNPEILKVFLT